MSVWGQPSHPEEEDIPPGGDLPPWLSVSDLPAPKGAGPEVAWRVYLLPASFQFFVFLQISSSGRWEQI